MPQVSELVKPVLASRISINQKTERERILELENRRDEFRSQINYQTFEPQENSLNPLDLKSLSYKRKELD